MDHGLEAAHRNRGAHTSARAPLQVACDAT